MAKILKNKPLVEAILEVRWNLQSHPSNLLIDSNFKLLLARLFDRLNEKYPEYEQLPAANMPEELAAYTVQHRFRVAKQKWPLVQVGPGIFTLNSTSEYTWDDFEFLAVESVNKLFDAYPKPNELKVQKLVLRYIDAVEFDYKNQNVFEFLKEKLKLDVSVPNKLFGETGVEVNPQGFTFQSSFKCNKPKGLITVRFGAGQKNNAPAIIWETTVESSNTELPELPHKFNEWIDEAHTLTDDWFFKMIEGDLERRFSGE